MTEKKESYAKFSAERDKQMLTRSNMHMAQSGKRVGQWVRCLATAGECPLGGVHATQYDLKLAQDHAGRRAFKDLTVEDYATYRQAVISDTVDETRKTEETLAEKKERLGVERVTPKQKPKKTEEQPTNAAQNRKSRTDDLIGTLIKAGYVAKRLDGSLPQSEMQALVNRAHFAKVQMSGSTAPYHEGGVFGIGGQLRHQLNGIELVGKKEDIDRVLAPLQYASHTFIREGRLDNFADALVQQYKKQQGL